MSLVEKIPFQDSISSSPPARINIAGLQVPASGRYIQVATFHSAEKSSPDYLAELLATADIFFLEDAGSPSQLRRTLQGVANGSNSDLRKSIDILNKRNFNPHVAAWAETVYKQLYGTKVQVCLPDYPRGDKRIEAVRSVTKTWIKPDHVNGLETLKTRDEHLIANICGSLVGFEDTGRILKASSLEAVSLYGLGHFALAEAINGITQRQPGSTFSASVLFDEVLLPVSDSLPHTDWRGEIARHIGVYQNWLRAPVPATTN